MSDYFTGTILPWPVRFIPMYFKLCNGAQLSVQQYPALFSIIGNTYGGDGKTYFKLPDLRNRMAVGAGTNPVTGVPYPLGASGGHDAVQTLPAIAHTHACAGSVQLTLKASSQPGNTPAPATNTVLAQPPAGKAMYTKATADTAAGALSLTMPALTGLSAAGVTQPNAVDTTPPELAMQYIICVDGLYPYFD
ncbi:phage tail protein [Magnetospirillum sp. UT-4]|uniref:phage tail protein n=1 Tax=Magnetospirillum sp. UT-4 TaxID=2681467 RepID=UPI0013838E73|nr:tail fiber protein [Magnetospirillum sp. UT-4]CAA7624971.1 Microcystin dependent protein [Magnetospirillum sp. UT-4]